MPEFFKVATPSEVFEILSGFHRLSRETVSLERCLGRVLFSDVVSGEDLPPRDRSTMDGFAVRAADTFGASDSVPAFLRVAGRVLMGTIPEVVVERGGAAEIPTGGFLPEGADAVAMVEYTNPIATDEIEVTRPVTAGENVLKRADDVSSGERILPSGRRLGPHEVGMLAALGIAEFEVFKRPRVAVISTGDEIVPVTEKPSPGRIRDINSHAICALVESAGALPLRFDIVADDPRLLKDALQSALSAADVVAVSGGSSVGARDHIFEVVSSFSDSRIFAHGVAISPGKPTLIAGVSEKPLFGLPGHPVSALIVARVFLIPFLRYLEGEEFLKAPAGQMVRAVLSTSIHSPHGREEYIRIKLNREGGRVLASPVFGKSGMISTLVKADGFMVVPIHAEGIAEGQTVEVFLF